MQIMGRFRAKVFISVGKQAASILLDSMVSKHLFFRGVSNSLQMLVLQRSTEALVAHPGSI